MKKAALLLLLFFTAASALSARSVTDGLVTGIRLEGDASSYAFSYGEVSAEGSGARPAAGLADRAGRVALFLLWLEREPFFLSPGSDLGGLSGAVSELVSHERPFLDKLGVKGKIYPADFLRSYEAASAAYDLFRSSPSEAAALAVLARIGEGVKAYSASAAELSSVVAAIYAESGRNIMFMLGGQTATDRATTLSDMGLLLANAAAARDRLAELEKCLKSSSAFCRAPAHRPFPAYGGLSASSSAILSAAAFGLTADKIRGPYLVESGCWGGYSRNYLYGHEAARDSESPVMEWDFLATDVFYRRTTHLGHFPEAAALGLDLMPISVTSPYDCADLGFKPALRALDFFTTAYASSPLTGFFTEGEKPDGALKAAASAEARFFALDIKSQQAAEKLAEAYFSAFLQAPAARERLRAELLARYRLIALKTHGLGLLVRRQAYHIKKFNFLAASRNKQPYVTSSIFALSRVGYSLFYMPFSPSVWVIPDRLKFFSARSGGLHDSFIDYRGALKLYGKSKVEEATKAFNNDRNWRWLAE